MFRLPDELKFRILLFLLDKNELIKKSGNWCLSCGEKIRGPICSNFRCRNCCQLHCIDNLNYYRSISNAPPFTSDEMIYAFKHIQVFLG